MDDELPPGERPIFLDPERAATAKYIGAPADEIPTFDAELQPLPELGEDTEPRGKGPSRGYEIRHAEIARLHALGYTNNQIARHLGYSATGISLALQTDFVQAEVGRQRDRYFNQSAVDVVKDSAVAGARYVQQVIHDPTVKETVRLDAAKWAVEKATGKAKQEIGVESGTLMSFMELMKSMAERGEVLEPTQTAREVHEVPQLKAAEEPGGADRWTSWAQAELAQS